MLARTERASLRIDSNVERLMISLHAARSLPSRNHVATHVESGVMLPVLWSSGLGTLVLPGVKNFLLTLNRSIWSFRRLIDTATIQALVKNLSLMREIT